ncbi:MAG: PDZ domain-containing protein, partial [Bacteroidia bacterium]|nr:PDZ domain-containing protein [Bacteroidia bacterium]
MNKLKSLLTWKKFAGLLIIIMFLSAFKKADDYFEISKNLEIFTDVYKEVNDSYVDETKPGALMKTGINAMLASLDPYTNFYSESEAEDAMFLRTGEYGGIGWGVIKRDNYIYISEIYEGHAADKAGLRIGDKVLEINGKSFVGATMEEISTGMRGASNSKASMVVERNGEKVAIDIIREDIKLKNVPYYGLINNETGYIKLEQFRDGASMEVKNALTDLKTKGIKQVMLDLRGNGGEREVQALDAHGRQAEQDAHRAGHQPRHDQ